ncbi:MAG: DUF459 domain-containing protein [Candidatus Nanopelagicales bacterium]
MALQTPTRSRNDEERFIDEVEHPAAHAHGRTLPAGKVLVVVVVALVTAMLLNSAAMVRAGTGMPDGLTRTLVLGVAEPVDSFAHATYLDRPREQLDALFDTESTTEGGQELLTGSAGILNGSDPAPQTPPPSVSAPPPTEPRLTASPSAPSPTPAPPPSPSVRTPTPEAPLRVLVTGDSLSTYIGQQMTNITADRKVAEITQQQFNGTGLTRPDFFNWQVKAEQQNVELNPEVVVMILGGNDGWNMTAPDGSRLSWGTQPWIDEYARRVAVVMQAYAAGGMRQVFWSGPPTARDNTFSGIFAQINEAVARAAQAIPGAHFVDLYAATAVSGAYSDFASIDGQNVLARQPDGVHFSYQGALQPARLLLDAMSPAYGALA